ncbi:DUF6915 family protein [Leptospira interrogans]
MAHPYHHALSSVRQWGGVLEDYIALHAWFDVIRTIKFFSSAIVDGRAGHQLLRHFSEIDQ